MANLHVAQAGFHLDTQGREPARLLQHWPTLVGSYLQTLAVPPRIRVICLSLNL
jgi:hypothetical protein